MCCCNTVCRFSLIQRIRYKSPIRRHLEELVLQRVILTLLPGRVIDTELLIFRWLWTGHWIWIYQPKFIVFWKTYGYISAVLSIVLLFDLQYMLFEYIHMCFTRDLYQEVPKHLCRWVSECGRWIEYHTINQLYILNIEILVGYSVW